MHVGKAFEKMLILSELGELAERIDERADKLEDDAEWGLTSIGLATNKFSFLSQVTAHASNVTAQANEAHTKQAQEDATAMLNNSTGRPPLPPPARQSGNKRSGMDWNRYRTDTHNSSVRSPSDNTAPPSPSTYLPSAQKIRSNTLTSEVTFDVSDTTVNGNKFPHFDQKSSRARPPGLLMAKHKSRACILVEDTLDEWEEPKIVRSNVDVSNFVVRANQEAYNDSKEYWRIGFAVDYYLLTV